MIGENKEERTERLARFLRRKIESSDGLTRRELPQLTFRFLLRPERLGAETRGKQRDQLKDAFEVLAQTLGDPTDYGQLFAYCSAAVEAADNVIKPSRNPGAQLKRSRARREQIVKDSGRLAEAAVYAEAAAAQGDADHVRRAVTRALREKRRAHRGIQSVTLEKADPLRALFELPERGTAKFVRGDVKAVMLNKRSPLSGLLRDAAAFSEGLVRPALGEELYGICRPVGFADARRSRVLVEVNSSAAAQELSFRQREIITRLNRVPGLERVTEIRFTVVHKQTVPVRRPRD